MTTPTESLADLLKDLHACDDAVIWAAAQADYSSAYAACEHGDWMLWIAARLGVDWRLVVTAACQCARLSLPHVPAGDNRPRLAIDTAERWTLGEATVAEVTQARRDAYACAYAGAAVAAGAAAAAAYTRKRTLARCAELVRASIPYSVIADALERYRRDHD